MPGGFIQVGTPEWEAFANRDRKPIFPVCTPNVDVPTISVQPNPQSGEIVMVQWFGEASSAKLGDSQFHFPLTTDVEAIQWFGSPEAFRIVFLDQLKNWPNQEGIDIMARDFSGGKETWVYWAVSSLYSMKTLNGIRCASFLGTMAMLGDPEVGLITPRRYFEQRVADEEQAKVAKQGDRNVTGP